MDLIHKQPPFQVRLVAGWHYGWFGERHTFAMNINLMMLKDRPAFKTQHIQTFY